MSLLSYLVTRSFTTHYSIIYDENRENNTIVTRLFSRSNRIDERNYTKTLSPYATSDAKKTSEWSASFRARVQAFTSAPQFPSIEVEAKETMSRTLGFQSRRLLEMTQGHGRGRDERHIKAGKRPACLHPLTSRNP